MFICHIFNIIIYDIVYIHTLITLTTLCVFNWIHTFTCEQSFLLIKTRELNVSSLQASWSSDWRRRCLVTWYEDIRLEKVHWIETQTVAAWGVWFFLLKSVFFNIVVRKWLSWKSVLGLLTSWDVWFDFCLVSAKMKSHTNIWFVQDWVSGQGFWYTVGYMLMLGEH